MSSLVSCYASVSYRAVGWGYWGYGYGHAAGAFSTSYGETGIVWNKPQGAASPPPQMQNDEPVEGSDGTFGWRRTGNADVEIHWVSERLAQKCRVEKYGYDETQALCNATRVLLRRDDVHVYLLCARGSDRKACEQAWVVVLA